MNKTISSIIIIVLILVVILLLVNRGTDKKRPTTTDVVTEEVIQEEDVDDEEITEITVSGTEFSFSPSVLRFKEGEQVRIVFNNVGRAPHNLTIEGTKIATKTISGGTTDIIEFTAPKSGDYTFFCSVPGHRAAGMFGTTIVE